MCARHAQPAFSPGMALKTTMRYRGNQGHPQSCSSSKTLSAALWTASMRTLPGFVPGHRPFETPTTFSPSQKVLGRYLWSGWVAREDESVDQTADRFPLRGHSQGRLRPTASARANAHGRV